MEKYDNNGKGGYFQFDDDNNMSYKYDGILIFLPKFTKVSTK